jgi:lysophospholipase L1-like esterase
MGSIFILVLIQGVLTGCALTMCCWTETPWDLVLPLALLGAGVTAVTIAPKTQRPRVGSWSVIVAWACSLPLLAYMAMTGFRLAPLAGYDAAVSWLVTAAQLPATLLLTSGRAKAAWKTLALTWFFLGSGLWLAGSYVQNLSTEFHVGLLFILAGLVACRCWFRLSGFGIQVANTLILLVVGLPLVDLLIRPSYHLDTHPETARRFYSFAAAKRNPEAFARWWNYYVDRVTALSHHIFIPDPTGVLPLRLKPNSHGLLFHSDIFINSRGFRGKEFPLDKGNAFRIVALGESTTFGCTLEPQDRPWPELLEQMIQRRLRPNRPVEVINAGVPALDLKNNLYRLPREILPLKPDMIISYHGYNGRKLLQADMPAVYGPRPPAYRPRPLKLLADAEYHLKMANYQHVNEPEECAYPPTFANPLTSAYAQAYEQLIQVAHTNHILLVLANFSMAVNCHSDPAVVGFYRAGFPSVHWEIRANEAHSLLVQDLAQLHPQVCLVDTHPHLDGENEEFIDLVHFTQAGRRQLAENIFAGIHTVLAKALASPPLPALATTPGTRTIARAHAPLSLGH